MQIWGEGVVYAMTGGAGGVDGLVEREWEKLDGRLRRGGGGGYRAACFLTSTFEALSGECFFKYA
jgi:hypothetical protein